MRIVRIAAAGLACWLLAPARVFAQTQAAAAAPAAAFKAEQIAIGAAGERMVVALWQPSAPPPDGRRLPLILISHGTGASPLAHADTAEALAAAGFVVAAPMHRGDNFRDDARVGTSDWMASRAREVKETIDHMLGSWADRARIDPARIGIFGFSAGASTALIAAGGTIDPGRVAAHCAAQPEFVCRIMKPAGEAPPPQWTHDPRISAAVVAAPGLGFGFEPASLAAVRMPVQLWAGSADETVPSATNAGIVRRLLAGPVDFHEVANAVHLSFLAPCGPDGPPALCQDRPGFDRAAFHRDFNRAVSDFFRSHLADPADPRKAE